MAQEDETKGSPRYRVEGSSIAQLAAKLAYLMRLENEEAARATLADKKPRVDRINYVMMDGSRVTISLGKKDAPASLSLRRGIEIDGFRLG